MHPWNYLKRPDGKVERFPFPNDERRNRAALEAAFREHGMEVADHQTVAICWTYVLTTDGDLYMHDTSHGGGGVFVLESRAK